MSIKDEDRGECKKTRSKYLQIASEFAYCKIGPKETGTLSLVSSTALRFDGENKLDVIFVKKESSSEESGVCRKV